MNWDSGSIRHAERSSIRQFMEAQRGYLVGRVLDFGAGLQPYKDLVGGKYVPFDKGQGLVLPNDFDAVMCNQVLQYIDDPYRTICDFKESLRRGGHLVMTYPTSWTEIESTDLWRFTKAGMERLLYRAGFSVILHDRRAQIDLGGFTFTLGYGVVAQA